MNSAPSTMIDPPAVPRGPVTDLLQSVLEEQRQLSAVEQFSQLQTEDRFSREPIYRSLLPATPPGPGEQYAFEVDLDRCSGCKACVAACHSLNGLDEQETWRQVGLLVGGSTSLPVLQHVTAACHHCVQPGCLIGCPVNAYEKDPQTGIVKHLDDQCFGCQYCTLACPYEVPQYHRAKGIVRKCDMCSSRLAIGQAPACVQSCPHQAISIKLVSLTQVAEDAETVNFLPGAPDPQITLPTTTYRTRRSLPRNLLPADYYAVPVQHAHFPLVLMLVLTQLSVGAFWIGQWFEQMLDATQTAELRPLLSAHALGFGLLALLASTLHLGRPWLAYRAVLGLRHSWLSREIVAFGLFAALATLYAGGTFFAQTPLQLHLCHWLQQSVAVVGGVALFCSGMIYVFTRRELWSFPRVMLRFLLTAGLLGSVAVLLSLLLLNLIHPTPENARLLSGPGGQLVWTVMGISAVKLFWEGSLLRHLAFRRMTVFKRSAILLTGQLSPLMAARFGCGILGGLLVPALLLGGMLDRTESLLPLTIVMTLLFASCLAGELLERYLFFAACAYPRMPGALR